MAIRKLNDPNAVSGWNSKMPFPKNRYTLRCLEEDIKPSRGGNPMVHLTWEIACGTPVQLGEKLVDIDGLKIDQYMVVKVRYDDNNWDSEKSDKAFGRYRDQLILCGFPEDGEIDDENPPDFFKGKVVEAIVYGAEQTALQEPTAEQKKKGQPGSPILGPDNKPVKSYKLTIDQILGLSTVEVNRPY